MREILFRGKRIDNGEWVEGYCVCESNHAPFANERKYRYYIFKDVFLDWGRGYFEQYVVIPETIGQYTGLKDKNGNKIFEGDILAFWGRACGVVRYGEGTFDSGIYCYTGFYYETVCGDKDHTSLYENCDAEVIGNIHDNPELLEVEQ